MWGPVMKEKNKCFFFWQWLVANIQFKHICPFWRNSRNLDKVIVWCLPYRRRHTSSGSGWPCGWTGQREETPICDLSSTTDAPCWPAYRWRTLFVCAGRVPGPCRSGNLGSRWPAKGVSSSCSFDRSKRGATVSAECDLLFALFNVLAGGRNVGKRSFRCSSAQP